MKKIQITVVDSKGTIRYWCVENANFDYAFNDVFKKCKQNDTQPNEIKMKGESYA